MDLYQESLPWLWVSAHPHRPPKFSFRTKAAVGKGSHCLLSGFSKPNRTTFLLPKREMSRPGSAPKPALLQHLPKFYSKNPKFPLQIKAQARGSKSFTKTALFGEKVVSGDHLVSPQVQGLDGGRCLGSPHLCGHHSRVWETRCLPRWSPTH